MDEYERNQHTTKREESIGSSGAQETERKRREKEKEKEKERRRNITHDMTENGINNEPKKKTEREMQWDSTNTQIGEAVPKKQRET